MEFCDQHCQGTMQSIGFNVLMRELYRNHSTVFVWGLYATWSFFIFIFYLHFVLEINSKKTAECDDSEKEELWILM